jgi:redox-sensing transcriptional repressor
VVFEIIGIFDVNPKVIGARIKDIEIFHMDKLDEFTKKQKVDIAMLTVPYEQAREVAEKVARLGIRGLWNFSPMDLKLPYDMVIENVHLRDSLMVLGFKISEKFSEK